MAKLFKESVYFCITCKSNTIHIIVDNIWICVAHVSSEETDKYWDNSVIHENELKRHG